MKRISSAALLLLLAAPAIAAPPLTEIIISTPNRLNPLANEANPLPPLEKVLGVDQQFTVKVGPPDASLSVSVVEPREKTDHSKLRTPKGTVLVLHGVFSRSATMLPAASSLTAAGYRAVLVDLRGHGRSTGKYMTFGVQEGKDLVQVIDELQKRNLVAGRVGVYGISYGATTAIHLAGNDPRVQAVVAVEPFSNAREEVPHFGRVMVPAVGCLIPDQTYQKALDQAGQIARYNPEEADAAKAIQRTSAAVLLIHGTNDWIVPHWNSERLHDAAPDHSDLVSVPWLGHIALWADPGGRVVGRACDWFDEKLKP